MFGPHSPGRFRQFSQNLYGSTNFGDASDFRGLLHDVGQGLATLSLLLDAFRDDPAAASGGRLFGLLEQETARLLELVHTGFRPDPPVEPVSVREVLDQIVVLAASSRSTDVALRPGADAHLRVDAALLWRVVANVVDNAVRAAGPDGHVEVGVVRDDADGGTIMIDVLDDGPGFRRGPSGMASLGLDIVRRLLGVYGGRLEVRAVAPHGTSVLIVLPDPPSGTGRSGAECAHDAVAVMHV